MLGYCIKTATAFSIPNNSLSNNIMAVNFHCIVIKKQGQPDNILSKRFVTGISGMGHMLFVTLGVWGKMGCGTCLSFVKHFRN